MERRRIYLPFRTDTYTPVKHVDRGKNGPGGAELPSIRGEMGRVPSVGHGAACHFS
jgi:hypothetical protein